MIKWLVIVGSCVFFGLFLAGRLPVKPAQSVELEGYEHANVICGIMLSVEYGHEFDAEVRELVELARERCPAGDGELYLSHSL